MRKKIPVALVHIPSYKADDLESGVAALFDAIKPAVYEGCRVLVKPNLVTPRDPLAVTDPRFVKAVCLWFIARGAVVQVGDSPAFGSAMKVAQRTGLANVLRGIDVKLIELDRPRTVRLACGISTGVSKKALDADLIVNCPRLKAHSQVGVTGAVKNFFGCVTGFRKAFAHCRYGDIGNRFESMIVELADVLPRSVSIIDCITAMDTTGPSGGRACSLGFAGASLSPFALDTALYSMLKAPLSMLPIQNEVVRRGIWGSDIKHAEFSLEPPENFDCSTFTMPVKLQPLSFNPVRMVKGRLKSLCMRLF